VRRALLCVAAFTLFVSAAVGLGAKFASEIPSPSPQHAHVVPAHVVGDPSAWVPWEQRP
jgi:hypothetical protein